MQIIRALWGDNVKAHSEIPPVPLYNEVVYVWGEANEKFLKDRGYKTRLVTEPDPVEIVPTNSLLRKVFMLDYALRDYDEIFFLDWDCQILRPLDDTFYSYLREKETQCPIYAQALDPLESYKEFVPYISEVDIAYDEGFKKYSWKKDNMLISPNFGCFYTRNKTIGREMVDIALEHGMRGCGDENAMFVYANCTLEEYIEKYTPKFMLGVSKKMYNKEILISRLQNQFNEYLESRIELDEYLEHM